MITEPVSCRSRRRRALVIVLTVVMVHAGCQQGGTTRPGVQFDDFGGYLEVVARRREQEQTSKTGAADSSNEETIFEEAVQLETEGYVYHPNFMEFALAGLFGLRQQDFEEVFAGRRRTSGDDGPLLEFDLSANFLKKKKYPGTVFARRYEALEPRPFQSSLDVVTTNYGLVWQYVDPKMPMSLQFNHTDVKLDPANRLEEEGRQTNTQLRLEGAYHFQDHNVLSVQYNHDSVEEEPFTLDFDTDELTFTHRLGFGADHRHRLDSELNFYQQKGTFDIDRFRWRELLRLQHSETLRSWYLLELLEREQGNLAGVPPIKEDSILISGTLEHELYDSLVSQFYGFYQFQDFEGGLEIERYGLHMALDYRKNNPWGVLRANYRARLWSEDREGTRQAIAVQDEARTFRDPEPIVLVVPDVQPGSIFITAEDRLTTYRRGRDYEALVLADRTEIRRVPTGRIPDGSVVLIDYVYFLGGDYTLETAGQDFSIQQDFDFGLTPYYRLRWQDQDLSPRDAVGVTPDDITAHIFGLEFERGRFRTRAEYEDHDSTINPFRALRLGADYTHRFEWDGVGILKARWSDVDLDIPIDRNTRLFVIEGRYRQRVGNHLTLEGAVMYREANDNVTGDDDGVDIELSLEWLIRETELRVIYEHGRFDDDFARNETSRFYFQLKRSF